MSVNTHGVTAQDVLRDSLPFAEGVVTETSTGLNLSMLDAWIVRAAGILNSLLSRNNINPAALTPDNVELVREGIHAYVAGKALEKREFPTDRVQAKFEMFESVKRVLRDMPADISPSYDSARQQVHSNLAGRPRTRRVFGDGKRW